jgi:hypothetical protein
MVVGENVLKSPMVSVVMLVSTVNNGEYDI